MNFELLRVIGTNYYGYAYPELLLSTVYIFNPLNLQIFFINAEKMLIIFTSIPMRQIDARVGLRVENINKS